MATLVFDASAALHAATPVDGFARLAEYDLIAPPLMWSEAVSSLHEARWRGEITSELARGVLNRLLRAPIERHEPKELHEAAWQLAESMGWAKTYDAEYVVLARLFACPLLTTDERLRRGAGRLVNIVGPTEV